MHYKFHTIFEQKSHNSPYYRMLSRHIDGNSIKTFIPNSSKIFLLHLPSILLKYHSDRGADEAENPHQRAWPFEPATANTGEGSRISKHTKFEVRQTCPPRADRFFIYQQL